MKKIFTLLTLLCAIVGGVKATQVTATWDWQSGTPASITGTNIQGTDASGTVASDEGSISLSVLAAVSGTNIKLQYNNSGYAQFNQNTAIRVPVTSTSQIVTVVSYPGQYNYTIGGIAAEGNTTNHTVTPDERTQGYVEIVATSTAYLYSITLSTFKDIKINLTTWSEGINTSGAATTAYVTVDGEGTASYATSAPSTYDATLTGYYHGTTYGWQNMTASVDVPGYIKITYGENDYGGDVSITNASGTEVATINNLNGSGKWSPSKPTQLIASTYYTSAEPTTLNFSKCPYVGYFAVEKMTDEEIASLASTYTLTYYDTDGTTVLGTQEVASNAQITTFDYTSDDCTIAAGEVFRGWFATSSGGQKYSTTTIVTADMALYAIATEIETSSNDKTYTFDLTSQYFYAEDHEAFSPTGGSWHDSQHGWVFGNGNTIDLLVGPKAVISVGICKYSQSTAKINVKQGSTTLATLDAYSATDGSLVSYDYNGTAGTLTLEIETSDAVYIHNIEIINYNSAAFTKNGRWYVVDAGSAEGFTQALSIVNGINGSAAEPAFIYLPNGTYDLGAACRTQVEKNVAIFGESRDGVIIKNKPTAPGIQATSTLRITGDNVYLQNLTLQNDYEYTGSDGVAVALEINGDKSICNNVALLSNQDTYYSNAANKKGYFKGGRIAGTVDYVCGDGTMWFEGTEFYNNARANADVIFAPATLAGTYGYVCNNCVVDGDAGQAGSFFIARPWKNSPALTLINTTFKKLPSAAGYTSMTNDLVLRFHEYGSVDADGNPVTGHNLTNCHGDASSDALYLASVGDYTYANVLGGWDPEATIALYSTNVKSNIGSWASFTPSFDCRLSDPDAKAYIITAINSSTSLTGETVDVLKAGEGYFIKTPNASMTITADITYEAPDATTGNMLVGCSTATVLDDSGNKKYFLGVKGGVAGLYYVGTSGITIPAGKCYLQSNSTEAAEYLLLNIDDDSETTGINSIENGTLKIENGVFYDLQGRKVINPTKGLYIVNGRKVVIK